MKQIRFIYLISIIFAVTILISCEKDEDESIIGQNEKMAESPSEGSSLSAENQKEMMESTGIALSDEITSITTSSSMEANVSFAYHLTFMGQAPLKNNYEKFQETGAYQVIQELNKLNNEEINAAEFLSNIKQTQWEPESMEEVYDSLSGKYSWNSTEQSWTYAESDQIIFEFPSARGGTSNNASFVVESVRDTMLDDYYYFGEGSWNEYPEDAYKGFIPTGLHFYLAVGDQKSMEFKYSSSFNSEGFLKESSLDFSLASLVYSTSFKNENSKEITATTTLSSGDKKLIEYGAGISGDISQANLENSIQYRAWNMETDHETIISAEDTADFDYYYPEPDPKQILNDGFAYFTIMDKVKLGGKVAIKDLLMSEEEIYPLNYWDDPNFDQNQATADWAAALNKHTDFFMANMEENTWMAKADFYVKEETDYQETYSYVALRLKFSDQSNVDPEVYFGEGFDNLIQELNNSMREVESAYSSY